MGFSNAFRTPTQLTAVARDAFDALYGTFTTAGLFPVSETYDISYSFGVGESILPAAAKFRSFNTESDVANVGTGETRAGKLPPISRRLHVDEHQQLSMYAAGDELIGQKFEDYAELIARAIAQRIVLAAAEAIETGKVTIAERKLSVEVDFGRKAGLNANAGTAWSTIATADPISDLEALRAVYGRAIGRVVISRQAMTYLQTNTNIIKMVLQRGTDLPSRVSQADVQSVFSAYGLGQLVVNEEVLMGTNGVERNLFTADKVILLPAGGSVGRALLGVTAESIRQDVGIAATEQPGVFAGAIESDDPSGYDVLVSALGLPVLSDANAVAVLDAY